MRQDEVMGDFPYDPRSEQVHQEMERDRLQMKNDLDCAWRTILDHLPAEWDKTLQDAVRYVEARAIGS